MSKETETTVAVIGEQVEPNEQETALAKSVTEIEFQAGAIVITNDKDYANAAEFGRTLKRQSSEVKAFFQPMKDAAHRAHKEVCDREKAMLKPLENAERILKKTMGAYVQEQERKRREAEEAARRAAQEEAERMLREACQLEADGDIVSADMALEEAQIMNDAAAAVSVEAAKPKAAGTSTRKDWEITDIDISRVPMEIAGVIIRPVDTAAVMRLIRSSKGQIKIDGITYKEVSTISFRK